MSSDLQIALIAALVGGGLAMLGSVLQHVLSLREDRVKRERDEASQFRARLTETEKLKSYGVKIGAARDIQNSKIAGRDIRDATITVGGREVVADTEPTAEQMRQLLAEIQEELTAVLTQQGALKEVSASAPLQVEGARLEVESATEKIEDDVSEEQATSIGKSLINAIVLTSTVLDGAKKVAEKTQDVVTAAEPLAKKLEPLVEKLGVAVLWAAKVRRQ